MIVKNKIEIGDAVKIINNDKIGLVVNKVVYRLKSNEKMTFYNILIDKNDDSYFHDDDLTNLLQNDKV